MRKIFTLTIVLSATANLFAQNVAVNTDGSTGDVGVMLDVKGTNPLTTTATQNVFQIKSYDANGLKMRMILGTNATATSLYGGMEVYDFVNSAYRALALQPNGGNVGIGITAPSDLLQVGNSISVFDGSYKYLGFGYSPFTGKSLVTGYPGGIRLDPTAGEMQFFLDNTSRAIGGVATLIENMVIKNNGNVGIGSISPLTKLDVNGAYSARYSTAAAAAAVTIPTNVSLFRLSATAGVQANALTSTTPQDGQYLTIINDDGDKATFAGFTIAPSGGAGAFVYVSTTATWRALAFSNSGPDWSILGNTGTVDGTNFIGTTDAISFNIRVHNIASGKIEDPSLATYNTSFGYQALSQAAKGSYNTALGYQAMLNNTTTDDYNTAVGYWALKSNAAGTFGGGQNNTAVGYQALRDNLSAGGFGNDAMYNVAVGTNAMLKNTTGKYNTAVGMEALKSVAAGVKCCTAVGMQALGDEVGSNTITGNYNTAMGYISLGRLTSGADNTCIGHLSGEYVSTGSDNTALGFQSLQGGAGSVTGSFNVAIGSGALNISGLSGSSNTALGYKANTNVAASSNRTAIGANSYVAADNCLVLGSINGTNGASASTNIGIGTTTPVAPLDVAGTINSASTDMRIGRFNGSFTGTGDAPGGLSNYCTMAPAANLTIAYGFADVANANTVAGRTVTDFNISHFRFDSQAASAGTITNVNGVNIATPGMSGVKPTNITGVRIKNQGVAGVTNNYGIYVETVSGATNNYAAVFQGGNVGIGTTTPGYSLDVQGGDINVCGNIRYSGAIGTCSDIRYKKDITPLTNSLNNVLNLQGVNYFWKTKDFPDKHFAESKQIGFIAQDIEKIYPEVVLTDKDGYKSVDYSKLTPVLVEAIKEQQKMINNLKSENEILKSESAATKENFEKRISQLETLIKTQIQTTTAETKK